MTKEEYVSMAEEKYEELQSLEEIDNFYDYEKEFAKIFDELGRAVLQENLSEVPADRRKKNSHKIWIHPDKQGSPLQRRGRRVSNKPASARTDGLFWPVELLPERP
jgi:hypothetical protein